MPFYEYECPACRYYLEVLQKISDKPLKKCPSCGKSGFKRLMSAPVFRLKGSGWYETDFKSDKEGQRNLAGAERDEAKTVAPETTKTETSKTEAGKPAGGDQGEAKTDAKTPGADKPKVKPESAAPVAKSRRTSGAGKASGSAKASSAARATARRPASRPSGKSVRRKGRR